MKEKLVISTLRSFLRYIKSKLEREKKIVIIILISIIIHAIFNIASPILVMKLIDRVLINRNEGVFFWLLGGMFLIPFIRGLLMTFEDYNANILGHKVVTLMRVNLFEKYLKQNYDILLKNDSGKYLNRIIDEPDEISHWIYITGIQIVLQLFTMIFILFFLFNTNFYLGIISLISLVLYLIPFHFFSDRLKKASKDQIEKRAETLSVLNEGIKAFYFAKAYSIQDYLINQYKESNIYYYNAYIKALWIEQITSFTVGSVKALGSGLVYIIGGYEVLNNKMTIGELIAAKMYIDMVYICSKNLFDRILQTITKIPIADRLNVLETSEPSLEKSGKLSVNKIKSCKFKEISLSFGDKKVLKNINLDVQMKKHMVIVGASGCGKSTLLNILIRLFDIEEGIILLNDMPLNDYLLESLRSEIVLCTQNPEIITDTVWENLTFGIVNVNESYVMQVVEAFNIDSFVDELPDKYNTVIGKHGYSGLSGGQIQRIALARAVIQCPQILLLDEAVNALDDENTTIIINAIKKFMKNSTIIFVTHSIKVAESFDSIVYFVKNGEVLISNHEDLMKSNISYQEHFSKYIS